ncbi:MAG: shikimate dehydrogenase [Hyphomicrobiales bacterium]
MPSRQVRAGVIGWPVKHSRSPVIHNYWLKKYGIEGLYELIPLEPQESEDFFRTFTDSGFTGANVTIPFKETAFHCISETDEIARRLGAVNTIYSENGTVRATSTDGYGFLAHLKECLPGWKPNAGAAVILGAGGAARAIAGALIDEGVEDIRIVNRTRERAVELALTLDSSLKVFDWVKRAEVLGDAGLLVTTTALGMTGNRALEIELAGMPDNSVVYDIVYTPLETDLLRRARARGLFCVDGLGMLLHQAVPGFELWFGKRPEVTSELRNLVIASLKGSQ